jgi:serine/threonine-protein kinase
MGSVYLAQHLRLPGKQVAVKVLRGGDHLTQEMLARFRREAEIASRLGHPNIVEVLDYDALDDGAPFLVLEYLRGESLASRLERGRLPLDEVFSFTRQMGSALQAAHGAGVVHRDLKPANVFLVPTDSGGVVADRVKLLDFGISKVLNSETVQTQESTIIGTPQYMAPEQAMGKNREIDARTDIFALGCIVYEMMTGKPVFGVGSFAQMIFRVVYEPPEPLSPLCPEASPQTVAAVERALAKNPADRYPDVASFVADLTGSPLHTLSPAAPGAQTGSRPQLPRAASGIAMPSASAAADEGFDATVAPGSVNSAYGTGRMGVAQAAGATGHMGMAQAAGSTGHMGRVQPEAPAGARPNLDPPSLEPTVISKQVAALSPERLPPPVTSRAPVELAPQPTPHPVAAPGVSGTPAPLASHPSQPVAAPVAPPAPSSRGPLVAAAALALFAAGGGVVWWMSRPEAPPTQPTVAQPPPATVTQTAAAQPSPPPAVVTPPVQDTPTPSPQPVATTTSDTPGATQRPVREELPEEVRKLLEEGEQALAGGDTEAALRLANRSLQTQRTLAAYSLKARAYCRQKDLGGAKAELAKVKTRAEQSKVLKFCEKYEVDLSE